MAEKKKPEDVGQLVELAKNGPAEFWDVVRGSIVEIEAVGDVEGYEHGARLISLAKRLRLERDAG